MKEIAIVDYGVGNLYSVQNACSYLGLSSIITNQPTQLKEAAAVILPGVGAFADAAQQLKSSGLMPTIREEAARKPLLGICLGMQLLFEHSEEGERAQGLGLIEGTCVRIPTKENLPQIGWNALEMRPSPIFEGLQQGDYVYFVHSYHCQPTHAEAIIASTEYGCRVTAAVQSGMVFGCQFHPEKSGEVGLQILKNFGALL